MRSEQEVLQRLILDTVALLCRNTLTYRNSLQVQGLIGVTMDSNVFIIHFDEKFDSLALKESAPSKAICSGQDLGLEDLNTESDITEIPQTSAQSNTRKTFQQRSWSREHRQKQRSTLVHPTHEDTPADAFVCDLVKEETDRVPVFPQPWPGFQSEPAESSTIPEGGCHNQLTPKTETIFMESEAVSYSQSSGDILDETRLMGGGSGFQANFSSNEFRQSSRRPQRKYAKSCDAGDSSKAASSNSTPYIITKSLHICAYPSCGKQFHHRHHLLRHQTMKHNRAPTKRRLRTFLQSSVPSLQVESSCDDALEQGISAYKTFGADQSSSW